MQRYHSQVCRAYKNIHKEAAYLENEEDPQMEVKAFNDSVDPDGIVQTAFDFGALRRVGLPKDGITCHPSMSCFTAQGNICHVQELYLINSRCMYLRPKTAQMVQIYIRPRMVHQYLYMDRIKTCRKTHTQILTSTGRTS